MSKGDAGKAQSQINYQGGTSENNLNVIRDRLLNSNSNAQNDYYGALHDSQNQNRDMNRNLDNFRTGSQDAFMPQYGMYQGLAQGGQDKSFDPTFRGQLDQAIAGYGDFAKTGGFSDQNIQDLRARAIAPTRAVYSNAQDNIDRQRSLSGYSPNYTAATAKMTRDLANSISDSNVNANASIAQMVQQGKLAGNQGLASTSLGEQGLQTNLDQLNNQMRLAGLSGMNESQGANLANQLAAMGAQNQLYGTTPGMANMLGNRYDQSNQDILGSQKLQQDLSQLMIQGQLGKSQVPSNFQQGLGNAASIAGIGGSALGIGKDITGGKGK